jgi:hypothetical protein
MHIYINICIYTYIYICTAVKKSEMELKVELLQMMIPGEYFVYM